MTVTTTTDPRNLHLSRTEVIPRYHDLLQKVRKVVKLFKRSPTKYDMYLQKYVKEDTGKELNLILDCRTRWNSLLAMIERFHKLKNSHYGVQTLINILRETYWILRGRRVISSWVICKRYSSKKLECVTAPLSENRVRDSAVFQISGIDTAGPLFFKRNQNVWVLLFTYAVYRAVHLELLSGVSTEAFLMALRRFVARRGRCSTIYCDNDTNFVGAANVLRSLDWKKLSSVEQLMVSTGSSTLQLLHGGVDGGRG
ncbi:hypothetical protein AVEN_244522-1 [Araneus ventricosus]|uniref:Integrase catalytic domain-containing protein n=1 Tax=Araneus ventricosus TaxID=182803 RepID=A0A4Y2F5M2_ARAVE|nr:hypothetical protein AVEN_244522-1 [Araneus ventricosus]